MFESGSAEDALKQLDDVMSRTENETVPGETLGIARRRSLVIRATIGDGIGRQDEVARSLALLETEADKLPDSLTTQSQVAYVRGLVALSEVIASRRLVISAGASHSTYTASGVRFRPLRVGEKLDAEAAKRKIVETPTRETEYLYVRAMLGTIPTAKR